MVKLSKAKEWNFPEFSYVCEDINDSSKVTRIVCITCKEFYGENLKELDTYQGKIKTLVKTWIEGSTNIKKSNCADHLKSIVHTKSVLRLKEKRTQTAGQEIAQSSTQQKTILECARDLTKTQKAQLIKKFQLAHFLIVNNKSFNFYRDLVTFQKDVYHVDVGSGYLSDLAAKEMIMYLSKSVVAENITDPLNSGERLYYSLLYDGSSNAKTMDEKELYLIKTCDMGMPVYHVLALEQPEDANALGLKASLDNAFKKGKFTFDRKSREIGLGSDGTNTNKALYRIEKAEIGDHLCLVLCLSHKLELALHDAFNVSSINETAEEQLVSAYYLFKRANLKWRLFKKHAIIVGKPHRRFKRPGGTRWVAHQVQALDTYLYNLSTFLGFLNNQISDPHNATMRKEGPRLEGILSDTSDLVVLIFQCLKIDILQIIKPTSLILESLSLILPEAITTLNITLRKIRKLRRMLDENGVDALKDETLFPTLNNQFLPLIKFDEDGHTLGRSTRSEPGRVGITTYDGYTLNNVNLDDALSKNQADIKEVLEALEKALVDRLSFISEDTVYSSAAILLDTKGYVNLDVEIIQEACDKLYKHFEKPLTANGFIKQRISTELEIMHQHIINFMPTNSSDKTWRHIFKLRDKLNIRNILHLVEICLVLPLSNAEVERVFSTFSKIMTKDRFKLQNDSQEAILRIRGDHNFEPSRYNRALEMFLTEYPNGDVRKGRRRLSGYKDHNRRSRKKAMPVIVPLSDDESDVEVVEATQVEISLSDISSDESAWSSSDSERD